MSFVNNVRVILGSPFNIGDVSINLVKAVNPYNDPPEAGKLTLMDHLGSPLKIEIIKYVGRIDMSSYWTLTGVTRGEEETTVSDFSMGHYALQMFTAADAAVVTSNTSNIQSTSDSLEASHETLEMDGGYF